MTYLLSFVIFLPLIGATTLMIFGNEDKKESPIPSSIEQIKNISQEEEASPKIKSNDVTNRLNIKSFDELIDICNSKKEIKLKYEYITSIIY